MILKNKILETELEEQNNNILNLMKENQILDKFKNYVSSDFEKLKDAPGSSVKNLTTKDLEKSVRFEDTVKSNKSRENLTIEQIRPK